MKKVILFFFLLALFCSPPLFAIAQDDSGGFTFDAVQLVALLNPVIVFLAIQGAKKITAINSTVMLAVLVPGISLLGAWLISLIVPDLSFLLAFVFGFLSTFIRELQKHLTPPA